MFDDQMDCYLPLSEESALSTPLTTLQVACWMWGLAKTTNWGGEPDSENLEAHVVQGVSLIDGFAEHPDEL